MLVREVVNFSSYWRSTTFSSTVEPTIYLLAFGFGFGSLVTTVGGYDYVEFVGTGTVATAVLFSSAFPAMFGTFVKYQFQRTYDAILAAPVDTEELVTAEALWIARARRRLRLRAAARRDGLRPRPRVGHAHRARSSASSPASAGRLRDHGRRDREVDRRTSTTSSAAVLTPLFLVAGTFFPLDQLPQWAQVLGELQPALPLRPARPRRRPSAGRAGPTSATSRCIVGFGLVMWRLAIVFLQRRLID